MSENDNRDFDDIYAVFHGKIRRYLVRLVGEGDADDVTQEVFMKVNAALGSFRGEASLSTWLYRIATNAATDHLRRTRRNSSGQIRDEDPGCSVLSREDDATVDRTTPLPDTRLIRSEMNHCIRGLAETLPENYRSVLVLSDFEELTNSEIAGVLGISIETVKVRLHRARTRLKKELECHCSFYRDERNELACDRKASDLK
jgi:RNA polymerase sigma-70 factor (ECF subfamily)